MRKYILLTILGLALLIMPGCAQIDHDITLKGDLSGSCQSKVMFPMPVPEQEMKKMLAEKGIKDAVLTPIQEEVLIGDKKEMMQGYLISLKWDKFTDFCNYLDLPVQDKPWIQEMADKTLRLELGRNDVHSMTFHVEGNIQPGSTQGTIVDAGTVRFDYGQDVSFSYKTKNYYFIMVAVIVVALVLIGVLLYLQKQRPDTLRRLGGVKVPLVVILVLTAVALAIAFKATPVLPQQTLQEVEQLQKQKKEKKVPSQKPATSVPQEKVGGLTEQDLVLAGLRVGESKDKMIQVLGQPAEQKEFTYDAIAGGKNVKFTEYQFDGVRVTCADKKQTIWDIQILSPKYKTHRGVTVGETADKVKSVYGDKFQQRQDKDGNPVYVYHASQGGYEMSFQMNEAGKIVRIMTDSWSL